MKGQTCMWQVSLNLMKATCGYLSVLVKNTFLTGIYVVLQFVHYSIITERKWNFTKHTNIKTEYLIPDIVPELKTNMKVCAEYL